MLVPWTEPPSRRIRAGSSRRRWYSRSSRPTAVASVLPGRPAAGGSAAAGLTFAAQLPGSTRGTARRAAQHPGQGLLHLTGQALHCLGLRVLLVGAIRGAGGRHLDGASRDRRGGAGQGTRKSRPGRLAARAAVPALDLAEPPDQALARADLALVQVRSPVEGRLAVRADEHLAVTPDAALPGTLASVRVYLPGAAAI